MLSKANLVGRQAYAEMIEIEAKFEKYTQFFYKMVKHLAY
jgi:hypothetical protein